MNINNNHLSIRTKTVISFLASFLLIIFILSLIGAYLINKRKQELVEDSIALAEEHGRSVAREITNIMEEEVIENARELRKNPGANACIELILRQNENVVMAAFVDSSGSMIIDRYQDQSTTGSRVLPPGSRMTTPLSSEGPPAELDVIVRNPNENLRDINLPVMRNNRMMGQIRMKISESAILDRISESSALITRTTKLQLIAVSILLILSYYALWRLFAGHVALIKDRDQKTQMATIGTLASGLAHEIRNPLNAMNVNLDVIREEMEDPREDSAERAGILVDSLQKEIRQLNETLSDFMKYAYPGDIEKITLNLGDLVNETLEFFSADFQNRKIRVSVETPDNCPVKADPSTLKRVLMNLVVNSIQALQKSEKKEIRIRIEPAGKNWRLTLTDTGPGFGDTDREKIFEVFYTTKSNGSGFGLAIARKIIQAHNGSIYAENASPEGGAKFHINLPKNQG